MDVPGNNSAYRIVFGIAPALPGLPWCAPRLSAKSTSVLAELGEVMCRVSIQDVPRRHSFLLGDNRHDHGDSAGPGNDNALGLFLHGPIPAKHARHRQGFESVSNCNGVHHSGPSSQLRSWNTGCRPALGPNRQKTSNIDLSSNASHQHLHLHVRLGWFRRCLAIQVLSLHVATAFCKLRKQARLKQHTCY